MTAPNARRWLPSYLAAGGLYLLASLGLWWRVWTNGPASVMTCDCTDAGRMVWSFGWSSFALSHGHALLFSSWLFHPTGLNLLTDTTVPAIALVMSPVTLLFGPVAAVNVAATVIPVAGALAMFWLLRHWVRWTPAAFVGGLAYGFSAAVIVQLSFGWLNLACTALLPLMVGCADELLVRQRARPLRVGALLGLLVVVEFFISTEVVLLVGVSAVVAVVLLVGYAGVHDRVDLQRRAPRALLGLVGAAVVVGVLLAYPVWLFVAGPAHVSGMVWSTNVPGNLGNSVGNFWSHLGQWGSLSAQQLADEARALGGYNGPAAPSPSYLGPGLLAVLVVGSLAWRSDRRLWFFGALGLITAALSLRSAGGRWGPWALVQHLPLFDNVVQSRFVVIFGLCASVMAGVIIDHTRSAAARWLEGRGVQGAQGGSRRSPFGRWRTPPRVGAIAGLVVGLVAVVPAVIALAPNLPLTVRPVSVPAWFAHTGAHLVAGRVMATYPFATADSQASVPWQAIEGMPYKMAGGGGPTGTVERAGAYKLGFSVLRSASVPIVPPPDLSAANLAAVRRALRAWGVTLVVVPDDHGLPAYQTARGTSYGVAFFTAVLGSVPTRQLGAWVWSDPDRAPPPVATTSRAVVTCGQTGSSGAADGSQVAQCILTAAGR
jgi:hypothetical protein